MGTLSLQDIFRQHYPAYERAHRVPSHQRKAARAIMQCRTAALGGHVQSCPDGHFSRIWYNSCRHRACPQCAFIQSERWLARQRARLLACPHYHVIFTVPHELNPIWRCNMRQLSGLLFQAVRDTLMELLGDSKYLGAKPGLMLAFHSWGRSLVLHPHLHALVSGGGLDRDGQWQAVRNGFLLPVRVVKALFRGKFIWGLRRLHERGDIRLPAEMGEQTFINLLNRLGHGKKTRWNVHIRERYTHAEGVATYIARYMRGGPLSNRQLVSVSGAQVTFQYKDHRGGASAGQAVRRCMRLPASAFIHRVLLHVPVPNTQVVRFYGLYHASQSAALTQCQAQLGQVPETSPERLTWQVVCATRGDVHPERCPVCGEELVCTGTVPRHFGSDPPGVEVADAA